ncbi:hypothetical protein [Streptomyces sp. NBC_00344]|uniref:hypothetical protein n=1 Tax=Streptomyces sp. NBC_00344 TaxID=2975720 RepID=UPI002E1EC086
MSARRPLLTATAAGVFLCALWFVPSANATDSPRPDTPAPGAEQHRSALSQAGDSLDGTHWITGGTVFLGLGAASAAIAAKRRTPAG